jgi:PAS domain S-box-containing protein
VIIEEDMTLSMVNNEFERLSGYARQDLEGKMGLIEFVAKQETETVKSYYAGIRDGAMPTEYEFSFVDRKGNEKVMVSRVGKISGAKTYIVSLFDMSSSEHELQLCVDELSQAHQELTQYVQALSYDLRTPMRAIRNYVDFLREDLEETLKKDHKAYLDGLDRALREAGDLVEGLLALLQINEKGTPTEKVHMGDFFRELIDALRPPPDINIMIGGDDWPTIEAQPILLRQIFHALIDNAVKFNNSALKLIEIDWSAVDDEAYKFYVRDNGIGIKQRYKDKIFGVFERLHTLEEYPGTGIGLAIVKKCTGELGGSVHMESEFGAGSTFFVTIPKVKEKTH